MNLENTTTVQDLDIGAALEAPHIRRLVDIIEELDAKISQWRVVAGYFGCRTPDELEKWFNDGDHT